MTTQVYTSYLMSDILFHSICTEASQEGQGRAARGKVTNWKILLTGDFTQLQQLSCLGNNMVYQHFIMNSWLKTRNECHKAASRL